MRQRDIPVNVRVGTSRLVGYPKDFIFARSYISNRLYFQDETELALRYFANISTQRGGRRIAIEVGANIGTQTIVLAQSGLFDQVVALEPQEQIVPILQSNLELNDFVSSVLVCPVGISDAPSSEKMFIDPENLGAASFSKNLRRFRPQASISESAVELKTLSSVIKEADIMADEVAFVWVDAEGFELKVIFSMLDAGICPNLLVVEFSPSLLGEEDAINFVNLLFSRSISVSVMLNMEIVEQNEEFFHRAITWGRQLDVVAVMKRVG